ncbi:unnamed protein product [Gordionus sp. m RMFG-2023]
MIWVEDRHYRIYATKNKNDTTYKEPLEEEDIKYHQTEMDKDVFDINITKNGDLFEMDFQIPDICLGFVIGKNASNLKRIENQTQTQLLINKAKIKKNLVDKTKTIIKGKLEKNLILARNMIEQSIQKYRNICTPTHFVSLPLNVPSIQSNFELFKQEILEKYAKDKGINEHLFQAPQKLHLTLVMLKLLDQEEVDKCAKVLKDCYEDCLKKIINGKVLRVRLKGIDYMNDDPSDVHVLYAKVDPFSDLDRVQSIADMIVDRLVRECIIEKRLENLKLHATVMISQHKEIDASTQNMPDESHTRNFRSNKPPPRESFDARNILKDLAQYDFGETEIPCLHLSKRFAVDKDGYYLPALVLDLE